MDKKHFYTPVESMTVQDAAAEIAELEEERSSINRELEELVREYARLTGDKTLLKKARRVGTSVNDWQYWHPDGK